MFSDDVLRILSYFDMPVKLGKIIEIIEMSLTDNCYASNDSLRISAIHALQHLKVRGFVKKNNRRYSITVLGLKYLTEYELRNEVRTALLNKVING